MASPYDFTPELRKAILDKLSGMNIFPLACPVCQHDKWTMPDGFATVPLLKNVWTNDRTSGLPCAALICDTCGNTILFNLPALGFSERIGPDLKKMMDESRQRNRY
jgi:hypothetical protein